jgi:hypothetical protein
MKGENRMDYNPKDVTVDMEEYIKSFRLVAKFRNDDESADYIKGYKDGYNKAIENLLNNIRSV